MNGVLPMSGHTACTLVQRSSTMSLPCGTPDRYARMRLGVQKLLWK